MKYYSGVGSRDTPDEVMEIMEEIAFKLSQDEWILRSGGAKGADSAFELGARNSFSPYTPSIYIPWNGFNQRFEDNGCICFRSLTEEIQRGATELASTIHPAWGNLSDGAKLLHARNMLQVLGNDLNTPSKFLICWAKVDKQGIPKGGTRSAWVLAKNNNIPCFNLIFEDTKDRVLKFLEGSVE